MTDTAKDKLKAVDSRIRRLFQAETNTMTAFRSLSEHAARDGVLPAKIKELTAVAIAVSQGCDDCVVFHTAAAKKHGAGREELGEILAVCVEMAGGPGVVYASKALEVYDQL